MIAIYIAGSGANHFDHKRFAREIVSTDTTIRFHDWKSDWPGSPGLYLWLHHRTEFSVVEVAGVLFDGRNHKPIQSTYDWDDCSYDLTMRLIECARAPLAHLAILKTVCPTAVEVRPFFEDLIHQLVNSPDDIFSMSPRLFEELVAELLMRDGFIVELTKQTKDGGRDILAYQESRFGTHLMLVEAKRFARHRPVGLALVQRLELVRRIEPAGSAALVTTSRFSRDAVAWQEREARLVHLMDGRFLQEWLEQQCRSSVHFPT